ncbi:zinc finger protein [Pseudohyphozyma bogoriensis]|nr:zinc finger protein [Pseudohyphozyma bogoriensis]
MPPRKASSRAGASRPAPPAPSSSSAKPDASSTRSKKRAATGAPPPDSDDDSDDDEPDTTGGKLKASPSKRRRKDLVVQDAEDGKGGGEDETTSGSSATLDAASQPAQEAKMDVEGGGEGKEEPASSLDKLSAEERRKLKGKGKATDDASTTKRRAPKTSHDASPDSDEARLRKEMAFKDSMLQAQAALLTSIRSTMACTVCLETLDKPYSLACGHVFCRKCLLTWFHRPKQGGNDTPGEENDSDSSDESDYSEDSNGDPRRGHFHVPGGAASETDSDTDSETDSNSSILSSDSDSDSVSSDVVIATPAAARRANPNSGVSPDSDSDSGDSSDSDSSDIELPPGGVISGSVGGRSFNVTNIPTRGASNGAWNSLMGGLGAVVPEVVRRGGAARTGAGASGSGAARAAIEAPPAADPTLSEMREARLSRFGGSGGTAAATAASGASGSGTGRSNGRAAAAVARDAALHAVPPEPEPEASAAVDESDASWGGLWKTGETKREKKSRTAAAVVDRDDGVRRCWDCNWEIDEESGLCEGW